jgi:flagellar FliL protein
MLQPFTSRGFAVKAVAAVLLSFCLAFNVWANEEKKEGEAPKTEFYNLTPALVGNYGSGPKLKYYKADIALMMTGKEAKDKVEFHEPLIRNQLVMLFAQQTDETLAGVEAREKLRQEALKQVQSVLTQEEGKPLVEDLLFNNLIIQP